MNLIAPRITVGGIWSADYADTVGTDVALRRLEAGRCPSCGSPARHLGDGWRRCVRAGKPYSVEFQVRAFDADLAVVFRHFDPDAA